MLRRGADGVNTRRCVCCTTCPSPPFRGKVRLVLSERRLPFELKLEKPWDRRPEYLEMNPAGTVPTLVEENGLVIPTAT